MIKLRLIGIILAILVVLTVFSGCSSSNTGYIDGTYEATSDAGMHPGLKLNVVIEGGNIAGINILEQSETLGIGTLAFEPLTAAIIEAQSTEVDSISGASLTSGAVKEAVDAALVEASN